MAKDLLALLWRDSSGALASGRRGPRARHSTGDVITKAIELADERGLETVTIRGLADSLGMTPMSVYTHVNSRDDLLVLMVDLVHARMPGADGSQRDWRKAVVQIAESNRLLLRAHPWILEIDDPRTVIGPGTIAKYDRELHAFDGADLDDVRRDAALTFVLGFARQAAARFTEHRRSQEFAAGWEHIAERLSGHLEGAHPLAQRVGRAAGEALGSPYDADAAWEFGLARVIAGLADVIENSEDGAAAGRSLTA